MTEVTGGFAILATESRTLAIGLSALLLSIPPIDKVDLVADVEALLHKAATLDPVLVIVDTSLVGRRLPETSREIHRVAPTALHVLLSENMGEFRELVNESQDAVIMKGTEPGRLARTLEYLLHDHIAA